MRILHTKIVRASSVAVKRARAACTWFSNQGRAKLRVFCEAIARKSTQLSPSLTRKPGNIAVSDLRSVSPQRTEEEESGNKILNGGRRAAEDEE